MVVDFNVGKVAMLRKAERYCYPWEEDEGEVKSRDNCQLQATSVTTIEVEGGPVT